MFSGQDLQFFLDASDEAWALADADGRVVARNQAWSALVGEGDELPLAHEQEDVRAALAAGSATTARVGRRGEIVLTLTPGEPGQVRVRARRAVDEAAERAHRLEQAINVAPVIVWQVDRDGIFTTSEGGQLAVLGLKPGQVVGMSAFEVYAGAPTVLEQLRRGLAGEAGRGMTQVGELHFSTIFHPQRDGSGEVVGLLGISVDITGQVRAEASAREQLERAERQQRQLQAMALPILQVWEGVLCVPVIGSVDGARAATITEAVLRAVSERSARAVIFDLTGLEEIDTQTASKLIGVLRGVELLGARGMVVGIRPGIAQTLVGLGVALEVAVFGTLEGALRSCLDGS